MIKYENYSISLKTETDEELLKDKVHNITNLEITCKKNSFPKLELHMNTTDFSLLNYNKYILTVNIFESSEKSILEGLDIDEATSVVNPVEELNLDGIKNKEILVLSSKVLSAKCIIYAIIMEEKYIKVNKSRFLGTDLSLILSGDLNLGKTVKGIQGKSNVEGEFFQMRETDALCFKRLAQGALDSSYYVIGINDIHFISLKEPPNPIEELKLKDNLAMKNFNLIEITDYYDYISSNNINYEFDNSDKTKLTNTLSGSFVTPSTSGGDFVKNYYINREGYLYPYANIEIEFNNYLNYPVGRPIFFQNESIPYGLLHIIGTKWKVSSREIKTTLTLGRSNFKIPFKSILPIEERFDTGFLNLPIPNNPLGNVDLQLPNLPPLPEIPSEIIEIPDINETKEIIESVTEETSTDDVEVKKTEEGEVVTNRNPPPSEQQKREQEELDNEGSEGEESVEESSNSFLNERLEYARIGFMQHGLEVSSISTVKLYRKFHADGRGRGKVIEQFLNSRTFIVPGNGMRYFTNDIDQHIVSRPLYDNNGFGNYEVREEEGDKKEF